MSLPQVIKPNLRRIKTQQVVEIAEQGVEEFATVSNSMPVGEERPDDEKS